MANNYVQFSEELTELTASEQAWLQDQLQWLRLDDLPLEVPRFLQEDGQLEDCDDGEMGFEYAFSDDRRQLWLYAEESGDPQRVGLFVQRFLQKFRPAEYWGLTYATTCDKPRIGEFGGGAIFVTAERVEQQDAYSFLEERARSYGSTSDQDEDDKRLPT